MARKDKVGDNDLFSIATYLTYPEVCTEIHAEIPAKYRDDFEAEYAAATSGFDLPADSNSPPYFVWPEQANKQGRELRIYFLPVPPQPPFIQDLKPRSKEWPARPGKYRINHTNLVMQLFECGFVLGTNSNNAERIKAFMRRRFPVTVMPQGAQP